MLHHAPAGRIHRVLFFVCLLAGFVGGALSPRPSYAQLPERLSPSARVEILTMAPGTAVHAVFGHSALRVVDPGLGLDAVFNYGTFNPDDPLFIPRFAYGDMQYFVSAAPGRAVMDAYAAEGRSVYAQTMRLSPDGVAALYAALRTNLEPENRTYLYDFVRDNCSTRLIDLLSLYAGLQWPAPDTTGARQNAHEDRTPEATFRELIRSYLEPHPWLDLGIDLVLGAPMERVPSPRERTFLPFELMAALEEATVPGAPDATPDADSTLPTAKDPTRLPAVIRTDTLFSGRIQGPALHGATRTGVAPSRAPFVWPFYLTALLLALVAFVPGRRGSPRPGSSRRADRLDRTLLWTTGLLGLFLLVMWLGTQHTVTSWNSNLLWAFPLNFLLLRLRAARTLSVVAAIGCVLAALSPALPIQSVPPAVWPFTLLLGALHARRCIRKFP